MATSEPNRLLKLPPELRNRIYELVIVKERAHELPIGKRGLVRKGFWRKLDRKSNERNAKWVEQPALTATCTEIRKETLPIFYGANLFIIDRGYGLSESCKVRRLSEAWLKAIGYKNRCLLKRLYFADGLGRLGTANMISGSFRFEASMQYSGYLLHDNGEVRSKQGYWRVSFKDPEDYKMSLQEYQRCQRKAGLPGA